MGLDGEDQPLPHGVAGQGREPFHLVVEAGPERGGRDGEDGDGEWLGHPAHRLEPLAEQRVRRVDRAEVEVQGRRGQAGPAAEPMDGLLGVLGHLRRLEVAAPFDDRQLDLVEFELGDVAKGRLQRLLREAERTARNEHPMPPRPSLPVLRTARDRHPFPGSVRRG